MKCESCSRHKAKETIKHNGRGLHVCRPCARVIKPERGARYVKRQTERAAAEKAKLEKAAAKEKVEA